jgi:hypothetical protein
MYSSTARRNLWTFFIFASKANLIMGRINNDPYSLCVFALVAGFSERFIPDLIERLEKQSKIH